MANGRWRYGRPEGRGYEVCDTPGRAISLREAIARSKVVRPPGGVVED